MEFWSEECSWHTGGLVDWGDTKKCENGQGTLFGGKNAVFLISIFNKLLKSFVTFYTFLPIFSVVEVNLAIYMFLESIGSSVCIQYQERYIFLSSSVHLFVKYQHNLVMRMHIALYWWMIIISMEIYLKNVVQKFKIIGGFWELCTLD